MSNRVRTLIFIGTVLSGLPSMTAFAANGSVSLRLYMTLSGA